MKKDKSITITQGLKKRQQHSIVVIISLMIITLILMASMLIFGNTQYSLETIVKTLLGEKIKGAQFAIMTIRLPRMLGGVLVGISLGIAGSIFQRMLRNPLASPDIIGVSSGSSVAAVFCILILNMSGFSVSMFAVISGLIVTLLVYALSNIGGFSGGRLILIGIGVQAIMNAVISYLLLKANQYEVSRAMRWLSGSLNGIQMKSIPLLIGVVVIFVGIIFCLLKYLKVLELGESLAITLGVRVSYARPALLVSAVFLIAFSISVAGPISFVAFLAGPIGNRLVGTGQSNTIAAGFIGAILVLGADLIGQFAFGVRFPVGVITGILGAPYLLFLLIRMNRSGGAS